MIFGNDQRQKIFSFHFSSKTQLWISFIPNLKNWGFRKLFCNSLKIYSSILWSRKMKAILPLRSHCISKDTTLFSTENQPKLTEWDHSCWPQEVPFVVSNTPSHFTYSHYIRTGKSCSVCRKCYFLRKHDFWWKNPNNPVVKHVHIHSSLFIRTCLQEH